MTATTESPALGGAPEILALAGTGSDTDDNGVSTDSSSTDALDALDLAFEAVQVDEQRAHDQADSPNASKAEGSATTEAPAEVGVSTGGRRGRGRPSPAEIAAKDASELTDAELRALAEGGIPRSRLDPGNSKSKPYAAPVDTIVDVVTERFLNPATADERDKIAEMAPQDLRDGLLGRINAAITAENCHITEGRTRHCDLHPRLRRLGFAQIAKLIIAQHRVIKVVPLGAGTEDGPLLAVYDGDPDSRNYGTYRTSGNHLRTLARKYQVDISTKEFAEIVAVMTDLAPEVIHDPNRDLIAAKNCIVDYNGGHPRRIEFGPEHIFLSKLGTRWNPDAESPVIPNPEGCIEGHADPDNCTPACTTWDVESWMRAFAPEDDPGFSEVLWQVIGAVVRPYVSWKKCALMVGNAGNNGKGTLLEGVRNLVGPSAVRSVSLGQMKTDAMVATLLGGSANLVDENDVDVKFTKLANFKASVTNDVITVNRKYLPAVSFKFWGFTVQCLNNEPDVADTSDSFYRRLLFLAFNKSFTGAERKYIKDDYLKRDDVLEYMLKRVLTAELTPTYYDLEATEKMEQDLNVFKDDSDPVRVWWAEHADQFVWDAIPAGFVYAVFKAWWKSSGQVGDALSQQKFARALTPLAQAAGWVRGTKAEYVRGELSTPEPLIERYQLAEWGEPRSARVSAYVLDHQRAATHRVWRRPPRLQGFGGEAKRIAGSEYAESWDAWFEVLDEARTIDANAAAWSNYEAEIAQGRPRELLGAPVVPKPALAEVQWAREVERLHTAASWHIDKRPAPVAPARLTPADKKVTR